MNANLEAAIQEAMIELDRQMLEQSYTPLPVTTVTEDKPVKTKSTSKKSKK